MPYVRPHRSVTYLCGGALRRVLISKPDMGGRARNAEFLAEYTLSFSQMKINESVGRAPTVTLAPSPARQQLAQVCVGPVAFLSLSRAPSAVCSPYYAIPCLRSVLSLSPCIPFVLTSFIGHPPAYFSSFRPLPLSFRYNAHVVGSRAATWSGEAMVVSLQVRQRCCESEAPQVVFESH